MEEEMQMREPTPYERALIAQKYGNPHGATLIGMVGDFPVFEGPAPADEDEPLPAPVQEG